MSKKTIGIFICSATVFAVLLSFTNCVPIHESKGSIEILSLSECEQPFNAFYNQTIKKFDYIGASFTCGSCHSLGGDDGPQYLDNFSTFASMSTKSSVKDKVNEATSLILRNSTTGSTAPAWDHSGGDFYSGDEISEQSVRDSLQSANNAFEACESAKDEPAPEEEP